MVPNPQWTVDAISDIYETLADKGIAPQWLPRLGDVRPARGSRLSGQVKEYGCGQYGCVYPTMDPRVVLKVTSDDTEAEFARDLASKLVRPICVAYYMWIHPKDATDDRGYPVYLLWRESAKRVGEIDEVLGDHAKGFIDAQHRAAQAAYRAIHAWTNSDAYTWNHEKRIDAEDVRRAVARWLETCEAMARQTQVPELRELGDGLVQVYGDQRIFFGDIHAGNLGMVTRPDGDHWVITDPGHVAMLDL
jgi:hypothetical protein